MDEGRRILPELSQLLNRYGKEERARFVTSLIATDTPEDFWEALAGLEFWGGSGAVWEIEPFHLSHPHIESSAEDYKRFQTLMIELADLLESRGLSELASPRARLFRRLLEETS
jgi:hypothetical protein